MKIHTLKEWQTGEHGGFDNYCLPYSYCEQYNTATYATFVKYGGSHYYLGNISPKAVNDEFAKLMELLK